jgi:hypothetical protein
MSDIRVQERLESSIAARVFAALKHRTGDCFTKPANGKTKHHERIP